jgi:hypothetical protein
MDGACSCGDLLNVHGSIYCKSCGQMMSQQRKKVQEMCTELWKYVNLISYKDGVYKEVPLSAVSRMPGQEFELSMKWNQLPIVDMYIVPNFITSYDEGSTKVNIKAGTSRPGTSTGVPDLFTISGLKDFNPVFINRYKRWTVAFDVMLTNDVLLKDKKVFVLKPEYFPVFNACREEQRQHMQNIELGNDVVVEEQKDGNICVVCMENPRDHIMVPCGHYCLCTSCKRQELKACPICRTNCTQIMKVFQ